MDKLIGHALTYIPPCQLRSYMSILYGLAEPKHFVNALDAKDIPLMMQRIRFFPNPANSNDQQPDKGQRIPRIRAPTSTVLYWRNKLRLINHELLADFDADGYQTIEECMGEFEGIYKFYTAPRYLLFIHV